MKKSLAFTFTALFFSGMLFAQKPRVKNDSGYDEHPFHFGFGIGLNAMDFGFSRPPVSKTGLWADVTSLQPGFGVCIVTDFRLGKYWNLRILPGINLGQRTLKFIELDSTITKPQLTKPFIPSMAIESNYVDVPVLFKYKAMRLNNIRPYLIGGMSLRYDWASRKAYDSEGVVFVRLKPLDVYYEMGVGLDNYFPFFKYTVELRYSVGLKNILVKTPAEGREIYVNSINGLFSHLLTLTMYFE